MKQHTDLLLATQTALLGEVVPSLRAVAVDWNKNEILIYIYNDGEISNRLYNDYSCIGSEVAANFANAKIAENIIRLDYPNPLPEHNFWAYIRKEDFNN